MRGKEMKKIKTTFFCQNCGHQSAKWLGRCPSCGEWNQFVEEEERDAFSEGLLEASFNEEPLPIDAIPSDEQDRLKTGIAEIDRVLGGGIVGGSAILIGGDPGIGKSTLLLQVMQNLAAGGLTALYVSGEESARQIKLRGARIGASSANLMVLVEVSLENILRHINDMHPGIVVIDSIQTVYSSALSSAPGSVSQIREASGKLILTAKKTGIPLF
jgi:DNA repair protein RadA/Sms